MIGELLLQTRAAHEVSGRPIVGGPPLVLDAIAIGTGPSFFDWIRSPLPEGKRYGCGVVPQFLDVDVYALGDVVHCRHAPPDRPVYATRRIIDSVGDPERFLLYPEDDLPHGGSSGGMALSLACRSHAVVGLIGFDGFDIDDGFITAFRELICYWKNRGKRLISLMPQSAFDDLLEAL
jgi:hypothetical protein